MRNSAAYFAGASIIKKKNILQFVPVYLVFSISMKIKKKHISIMISMLSPNFPE
jgi:hypothetical protein